MSNFKLKDRQNIEFLLKDRDLRKATLMLGVIGKSKREN